MQILNWSVACAWQYDRERLGGGDGINGGNYQQNHNHTPKLLSEDLIQGRKEWHNIQVRRRRLVDVQILPGVFTTFTMLAHLA